MLDTPWNYFYLTGVSNCWSLFLVQPESLVLFSLKQLDLKKNKQIIRCPQALLYNKSNTVIYLFQLIALRVFFSIYDFSL